MGFKKHNWMSYGRFGDIIEITIRDNTGRKLDFFRCNNNQDYGKVVNIIKKYGFEFKPEISKEDSINTKKENKTELEKEKDWLK